MDPKKLSSFRSKLEEIRADLLGDVEKNLKSSQEDMVEPLPDITDGAAQAYSRQLMLDLGEQDWQKLKRVDEALEKIESGDFGICINCEEAIPEPRLNIVPFAEYCVECLSQIENESTSDLRNLSFPKEESPESL